MNGVKMEEQISTEPKIEQKDLLNDEQRDDMMHAIGRPILRKNWKSSTILNKAYRNKYYTVSPSESWEDLVKKGFANVQITKNYDHTVCYFYYVTEKGIDELRK